MSSSAQSRESCTGRRPSYPTDYIPPPRVTHGPQYNNRPPHNNDTSCRGRGRGYNSTKNKKIETHLQYCQFKTSYKDMNSSAEVNRPFQGRACHTCTPTSRSQFYTETTPTLGYVNVLRIPYDNRQNAGFMKRLFPVMCLTWKHKSYQFSNIRSRVLHHQRIKAAIDKSVNENIDLGSESNTNTTSENKRILNLQWKRVLTIYREMRATLSPLFLRFTAWFLHRVLSMFLSSIIVNKGQMKMLKDASSNNVPLILLPLHRSHLDYVLITFILWNWDIRPPFVAAGDNLRLPIFSKILRWLGGFFIRRKLDNNVKPGRKDRVYRAMLHTYLESLLLKGESLEFYLEGGRSRTGKSLIPKGGIISVIIDAYNEGIIGDDAYIVPISMSYEKLLEGNFNDEQLGKPKQAETFMGTVKSIITLFSSHYGHVRVDFCQPLSLKECIESMPRSCVQLNGTGLPSEVMSRCDSSLNGCYGPVVTDGSDGYRSTVRGLAEHVVYAATQATALMSTNVLAFLILYRHRNGVAFETLVESFDWLRDEVMSRGRDVGFTGSSTSVIYHAASVLGPDLVSLTTSVTSKSQLSPTQSSQQQLLSGENNNDVIMVEGNCTLPHIFQLAYYANSVVPVFISESITANAVCIVAELTADILSQHDDIEISKQALFNTSLQLCKVLINEFLFTPPCSSIPTMIYETMNKLMNLDILQPVEEFDSALTSNEKRCAQTIADQLAWSDEDDDDDDDDDDSRQTITESKEKFTVHLSNSHCKEWLLFLSGVAGPLLESYQTVASCLCELRDNDMLESDFVKTVHGISRSKAEKKQLLYLESCGLESIKNAVKYFINIKILSTYSSEENCVVKFIKLQQCSSDFETIDDIQSRFNKYVAYMR